MKKVVVTYQIDGFKFRASMDEYDDLINVEYKGHNIKDWERYTDDSIEPYYYLLKNAIKRLTKTNKGL